jgi:uncharacterized protein
MKEGKPAGIACVQLDADYRCKIFGQPNRPACCSGLQASLEMCGNHRDEALAMPQQLEVLTRP